MELVVGSFAFLFGAAIGSFLNVCIARWPEGLSVISPRSRCPRCNHDIGWADNIPILSWFLLRGRCRECHEIISLRYPLIEIATALVWATSVARYGVDWQALVTAIFFTILLGIAITDGRTYTIPHEFSIGGLLLGLALATLPGGLTFVQSVTGALLGFGALYLTGILGDWLFGKPSMGGGDIWMMAMVGAFLGPVGALLTIFLGALVGTLAFMPIWWRTKKNVPFGVFLAIGAAMTEVWGKVIFAWYETTLLG